jgi:hypothetical protein
MADIVFRDFVTLDRFDAYGVENEVIEYFRLKNDINGSSRVLFHWLPFSRDGEWYEDVVKRLQNTDGLPRVKKYRGKWYGGGIVFSPNNLKREFEKMWDTSFGEPKHIPSETAPKASF